MYQLTILDIIKDSSVTKTIWTQELNSTQDYDTLKLLLQAYTKVATESLCCEQPNNELHYHEFYNKVLNKFNDELSLTS